MSDSEQLTKLEAGMPVLAAGGKVLRVSPELAAAFQPGDTIAPNSYSQFHLYFGFR